MHPTILRGFEHFERDNAASRMHGSVHGLAGDEKAQAPLIFRTRASDLIFTAPRHFHFQILA